MNEKPKLRTKDAFDYSEIVSYIEEKYHIDTRDYSKQGEYKDKWIQKRAKELGYDRIEDIPVKVNQQIWKEYQESDARKSEPPHIDLWHWLLDYPWDGEIHNGCYQTFDVEDFKETATNQKANEIVKMLNLFEEEFGKEFKVWIDW